VTLADAEQIVGWMIQADAILYDLSEPLCALYKQQMEDEDAGAPLLSGVAERVLLRAMLESVKACGWPVTAPLASWAAEPITAELAIDRLRGLQSWEREVPYRGGEGLALMLAHHMGAQAAPVLAQLLADTERPLGNLYRDVGSVLSWLCVEHKGVKAATVKAIKAIKRAEEDDEWESERELLLDALKSNTSYM
jgi:hypothetical protein